MMFPAYSTLGLPDVGLDGQIRMVKEHGYSGIEIALTPEQITHCGDDGFWKGIASDARDAGLVITCLHLGNPRLYEDPGAPRYLNPDPEQRARHVRLGHAACDIARRVGCGRVAVASGAPVEGMDDAEAWRHLLEGLAWVRMRLPEGCELLVEHEPEHFIRTADQIVELAGRTGEAVLCNLDVGHVEVAGEDVAEVIARLGAGIIRNVHFEDIKDRVHKHLLPGDGQIDFSACGGALRRIGYNGPVTADLYPFASAPDEALRRGIAAFTRHFEPADEHQC